MILKSRKTCEETPPTRSAEHDGWLLSAVREDASDDLGLQRDGDAHRVVVASFVNEPTRGQSASAWRLKHSSSCVELSLAPSTRAAFEPGPETLKSSHLLRLVKQEGLLHVNYTSDVDAYEITVRI